MPSVIDQKLNVGKAWQTRLMLLLLVIFVSGKFEDTLGEHEKKPIALQHDNIHKTVKCKIFIGTDNYCLNFCY